MARNVISTPVSSVVNDPSKEKTKVRSKPRGDLITD